MYKFDKEILEIRKQDFFMLMAATRRWMLATGFDDDQVAKITAKIFALNKLPMRVCEDFCHFVEWGDMDAENEGKIN